MVNCCIEHADGCGSSYQMDKLSCIRAMQLVSTDSFQYHPNASRAEYTVRPESSKLYYLYEYIYMYLHTTDETIDRLSI